MGHQCNFSTFRNVILIPFCRDDVSTRHSLLIMFIFSYSFQKMMHKDDEKVQEKCSGRVSCHKGNHCVSYKINSDGKWSVCGLLCKFSALSVMILIVSS